MARGMAYVWNEWGIQILVVASFVWQVILLVTAGIRRRRAHFSLRFLLWLVYLLADSTAIYALGHLSFTSRSREHRLVAFWAPFLLVHLGGPDSITAYSLEDNRLWLRHLFTLLVQVAGAAFVIYKYVYGTGTLIMAAASLMFVVGVLKYGERTWALKCGTMDSIRNAVENCKEDDYRSIFSPDLKYPFPDERRDHTSDDDLLISAHSLFHMCKSLFVDLSLMISTYKLCSIGVHAAGDLYKLVEMELSLMYDILYTKATVIHTWYGYCIRVVSLLGTLGAFLLFQFSDRSGYSRVDVVITYVLLAGALVLEIISVVKTLRSTWTCAMLYCMNWKRSLYVLQFLRRRHFTATSITKRLWSGSIGQYNMFHLCTRDTSELGSTVASKIWLEDKWKKMHFSGTFTFTEKHKKWLRETLKEIDGRNSRGTKILEGRGFDKEKAKWSHWALNTTFDESIIVWHIATEVYLFGCRGKLYGSCEEFIKAIEVLSNYMMYLLVIKPDMLPGPTRKSQYAHSCNILDNMWRQLKNTPSQTDIENTPSQTADTESAGKIHNNAVTTLKSIYRSKIETLKSIYRSKIKTLESIFRNDGPRKSHSRGDSRLAQKWELGDKMKATFRGIANQESLADEAKSLNVLIDGSACIYGLTLATELSSMESKDMLTMIYQIWVQILCYAAHHCSRDSHARQLSSGGELITIVWLLKQHILMQPHQRTVSDEQSD